MIIRWPTRKIATLKEVEELMILPGCVRRKMDKVTALHPPDKDCELLDGELTHENWSENDSENFTDSDDSHNFLEWEDHYEIS